MLKNAIKYHEIPFHTALQWHQVAWSAFYNAEKCVKGAQRTLWDCLKIAESGPRCLLEGLKVHELPQSTVRNCHRMAQSGPKRPKVP